MWLPGGLTNCAFYNSGYTYRLAGDNGAASGRGGWQPDTVLSWVEQGVGGNVSKAIHLSFIQVLSHISSFGSEENFESNVTDFCTIVDFVIFAYS